MVAEPWDAAHLNFSASNNVASTEGSAAQMIASDAADWTVEVQKLPSGRGTIDSPDGIPNQLRIRVMWDDEGAGVAGINCGNDPAVDLTCYTVTLEQ